MMRYLRSIKIQNGSSYILYDFMTCDECNKEMEEGWPHYSVGELDYCTECAFKIGLISESSYLKTCGVYLNNMRAGINPETSEVEITNTRFSWEKTDKDYRKTKQYKEWRLWVFRRDAYTCIHCGKVGGSLEAHHIYPFKKYKSLRYEINNGITLCRKCHLAEHSKAVKK